MRKDGGIFVRQPMKNFDRHIEFHRARNVNKRAGADLSTMQGREFGGTKCCGLGHEIFTHEVLVLDQRAFQRLKNHPGLAQRFWKCVALEQLIVGKNQTPGFAIECG